MHVGADMLNSGSANLPKIRPANCQGLIVRSFLIGKRSHAGCSMTTPASVGVVKVGRRRNGSNRSIGSMQKTLRLLPVISVAAIPQNQTRRTLPALAFIVALHYLLTISPAGKAHFVVTHGSIFCLTTGTTLNHHGKIGFRVGTCCTMWPVRSPSRTSLQRTSAVLGGRKRGQCECSRSNIGCNGRPLQLAGLRRERVNFIRRDIASTKVDRTV